MNVASLTQRLAPPHDPFTLLLTRRDHWRDAGAPWRDGLSDDPAAKALELSRLAPMGLDELGPLGTLGGALVPAFAALAPDGALYLLDKSGSRLLWFDRCACAFTPLPCLPAKDWHDPRRLSAPAALAADRALLAVAGLAGGKGRVVVVSRATLSIVALIEGDFAPTAVALRGSGVLVADSKSGALVLFGFDGRERRRLTAVGVVQTLTELPGAAWLAVTEADVSLVAPDLARAEPIPVAAAKACAPAPPFVVDGRGRLELSRFCIEPQRSPRLFDASGASLSEKPVPQLAVAFARAGRFVTEALDSAIETCQWHRVILRASVPKKASISLRTRAAALDFPLDMAAPQDAPGWSAPQVVSGPFDGAFECLVLSGPGRWLWLELVLQGDGTATPAVHEISIEFPRISLARFLPSVLTAEPVSADLTHRFLSIFDTGFRSIEKRIDGAARLYDPRTTPAKMLDWLASWVGLSFPGTTSVGEKRRLLRVLPRLFPLRGTLQGLEETLAATLGFDMFDCPAHPPACGPKCPPASCTPDGARRRPRLVLEHWRLRRWLFLGQGRLGAGSQLWGEGLLKRTRLGGSEPLGSTRAALERDPFRDPFHLYAHRFTVFLPAARASGAAARARVEALIRREAPAHCEPELRWVSANMRLGPQSTLGFDSVIGSEPPGCFGVAPLGDASVLSGGAPPKPRSRLDRSWTLGRDAGAGSRGRI